MSDRKKLKTKGGGGKGSDGQGNTFWNNNQPNNKTDSHISKIKDMEISIYIVSQFTLAVSYEKVTEEIIRYVIKKLPGGVYLARGMRDDKLPNMSLDPKPKQEKSMN